MEDQPAAPAGPADHILRHTAINIAGAIIPLAVAFFAIPRVIVGLGMERFGVLTLAVAIVGYFGVFDLGLGRATTRFMASALGRRDETLASEYFWTALAANVVLGLVGGALFAAAAPFLAERVLTVSPALVGEVTWALRGIAALIPLTIVNSALVGSLEAQRRFGLVNAVQVPAATMVQLVPLISLLWTRNVAVIVAGLVVVRALLALAVFLACLKCLPALRAGVRVERRRLGELLNFGGWLTVTNVVGPLMVNGDRFLIGSMLSVAVVPYYATPYDMVTRLSVISAGLSRSLFPVFAASAEHDTARFVPVLVRSTRILALVLALGVVPVVALSPDLLRLWLGAEFAGHAAGVLAVLAVGVLVTSLAYTPYSLIQGLGRPDLTAKFHLLELCLYVPLVVGLLLWLGVLGAAIAWTVRVTLDAVLLIAASRRMLDPDHRAPAWGQLRTLALLIAPVLAAAGVVAWLPVGAWARLGATLLLEGLLVALAWRVMLEPVEWSWCRAAIGRLIPAARARA